MKGKNQFDQLDGPSPSGTQSSAWFVSFPLIALAFVSAAFLEMYLAQGTAATLHIRYCFAIPIVAVLHYRLWAIPGILGGQCLIWGLITGFNWSSALTDMLVLMALCGTIALMTHGVKLAHVFQQVSASLRVILAMALGSLLASLVQTSVNDGAILTPALAYLVGLVAWTPALLLVLHKGVPSSKEAWCYIGVLAWVAQPLFFWPVSALVYKHPALFLLLAFWPLLRLNTRETGLSLMLFVMLLQASFGGGVNPLAGAILDYSPELLYALVCIVTMIFLLASVAFDEHRSIRTVLDEDNRELEKRVEVRTRELEQVNQQLKQEAEGRDRAEFLLQAEKEVLQLLAENRSVNDVLTELLYLHERLDPKAIATVCMIDRNTESLNLYVTRKVPTSFVEQANPVPLDESASPCVTAIFSKKPAVLPDLKVGEGWEGFRDFSMSYGYRAFWSTPILSEGHQALGTFAIFYKDVFEPSTVDQELVDRMASLAGVAIERKLAEEAIAESDEKYRIVFENESDVILVFDAETLEILEANPAVKTIYGYERDEVIGQPVLMLSGNPKRSKSVIKRAEHGVTKVRQRNLHRRKDGTIFPIEVRQSEITIGGRAVVQAIFRDITEQQNAENVLRASEQRFRDFAETAADWFWEVDASLNVVYLSERYLELFDDSEGERSESRYKDVFEKTIRENQQLCQHMTDQALKDRPFKNIEAMWNYPEGTQRVLRVNGKPIFDQNNKVAGYRGIARDVTDAITLTQQLAHQASHDPLTGLVNRREFEARLERIVETAQEGNTDNALCYVDLDQFKVINDTCGHSAGDELLIQLAQWLKTKIRTRDTLARLGGDEFGIIMEHCSLEQARLTVSKLLEALSDFQFRWKDKTFRVGMSIGLVAVNSNSESLNSVMSIADAACYSAKDEGRNRIYVASGDEDGSLARRQSEMRWVSLIDEAIGTDGFVLYAQPIVQTNGGITHIEILLRMQDADGSTVPPGAFLPAAERYHRSTKLDRWVIEHTCRWLGENRSALDSLVGCSINLSGHSLTDMAFADYVVELIEQSGVAPERLCFEITETVAIANFSAATHFINRVRSLGCRFALDDFGSGLSSFAYLKNLPVDYLKIDGMFVKDIVDDPIDFAMVKSINDIAHVMGKATIAEFVENQTILDMLASIGVDYVQGYHLGKPKPLDEMLTDISVAQNLMGQ